MSKIIIENKIMERFYEFVLVGDTDEVIFQMVVKKDDTNGDVKQTYSVQSSNDIKNWQLCYFIGSPVWKPRDSSLEATSSSLPRKGRDHNMAATLNASRKSLIETSSVGLEVHNSYNQQ